MKPETTSSETLMTSLARIQAEVAKMQASLRGKPERKSSIVDQPDCGLEIAERHSELANENALRRGPSSQYIVRICLTGGPCAGKTTGITHITERLRERGYEVFVLPEAASMIFGSGARIIPSSYTAEGLISFQYHLLLLQMMVEDIFHGIAANSGAERAVLICDRGVMDGSAYMPEELWTQMLYDHNLNESRLRDQRYDQVIHLCTAADGAEEFYTLGGNSARSESPEEARRLDALLIRAWMQHPNFVLIHNRPYKNFGEKLDALLMSVYKFLGEPLSATFYKKFIVANPRAELAGLLAANDNLSLTSFDIEDHIFFEENGQELRYYRKRRQEEATLFTLCKKVYSQGQLIEIKRLIRFREFKNIANLDLPNKYVLKKQRVSFTFKGFFFLLDTMTFDGLTLSVLTAQGFQNDLTPDIPDIIRRNIVGEVRNGPIELVSELLARNQASIIGEYRDRLQTFNYDKD